MLEDVAGKVVLVTGAASGIGAGHARVFGAAGVKVVCADIQVDQGRSVAESVRDAGGEADFTELDVSNMENWQAAVADTLSRHGRLDFLINNAGIYQPAGVVEETPEAWQRMIAINQTGVMYGMKAVIPAMLDTGGGAIVNISSLYGIIGSAGSFSYHATKGAVRLMTKAAALEHVNDNIRINSIHPGQIDTPILANLTPELDAAIKARIPMGRLGTPEEVARASLFLCSDMASYITGEEMRVDGGWCAT
jgi:2,5-dichloro-2,5-cyclohexadiene-1,4-diol dehydrogenase 2